MISDDTSGTIWKLLKSGTWERLKAYDAAGLRHFEMPDRPGEIKIGKSGGQLAWFPRYHNPNKDQLKT